MGPSTTALLTTTRRLLTEPAPTAGAQAAAAPFDTVVVAGGTKARPVTVADRARTASVAAARRRRRVLVACLLPALAGWTGFGVELVAWPVAAASTVLLPVDLVALVVSARVRARRRRAAARAVAREVARADHWRQVHEHEEIRERERLQPSLRPEVMAGAELSTTDGDTAELDLRPVAAALAATSPPWRVDPADGVMLDDGPVTASSMPVWALMAAAAATAAATAAPGSAAEAAPGWPQVERRVRDRRALRRPTPDRRASENLGTGRRLTAVEGTWQPVAVPLPTYAMKSQAPRNPATLGADGVEPEVAVRPGVARPWLPERPGGEAVDLDEVLARRRAVNG